MESAVSNTDFEDDLTDEPDAIMDDPAGEVDEPEADDVEPVEAEADDGVDVEEPEEEQPRRSRENDRIRTLRERAEEEARARAAERERADRFERELSEIRARTQAETESQKAERLALMTPEERSEYRVNEALNSHRREIAAVTFRMEDQADKAAFQAKAAVDPLWGKWADQVEAKRVEFLRQGTVVPRAELLKWLVGESVLSGRGPETARQAARGKENIRRQQVSAATGRTDVSTSRRRSADTPAKRLEGMQI